MESFFLSSQARQSGFSIDTVWAAKSGTSKLTLRTLQHDDSGNYSCTSNGFESEKVLLRVVANLKGKYRRSTA